MESFLANVGAGRFNARIRITVLAGVKIRRLVPINCGFSFRVSLSSEQPSTRAQPARPQGSSQPSISAKRRAVLGDERLERFRGHSPDFLNDVGLRVELAALVSLRHAGEMLDQVRRQLKLRQDLRPALDRQIDVLHPLA